MNIYDVLRLMIYTAPCQQHKLIKSLWYSTIPGASLVYGDQYMAPSTGDPRTAWRDPGALVLFARPMEVLRG